MFLQGNDLLREYLKSLKTTELLYPPQSPFSTFVVLEPTACACAPRIAIGPFLTITQSYSGFQVSQKVPMKYPKQFFVR